MKTIKQIREDYNGKFLLQDSPEEIMLEANVNTETPFSTRIPSSKEIPAMLIFKRISLRVFPGKNVVVLYYSKILDKYLTIPFGPKGNVNLSEAVIIEPDMLDEDWKKVNRRDRTSGMSQAAVNAYRRENPGSKLQTAVTEKNPTGKRASRRKSFCSRMGGMKKRLTSAKTARDPDSRINKALRRWNCEESFRVKLEEKRQERLNEFAFIAPALAAAGEVATGLAARGLASAGARGLAAHVAKRGVMRTAKTLAGKAGRTTAGRAAKEVGKWAAKKALSPDEKKQQGQQGQPEVKSEPMHSGFKAKTFTAGSIAKNRSTDTLKSVESQAERKRAKELLGNKTVQENKVSDLRNMLEHGNALYEMQINGRTIQLNNTMAKRIVEVYDSVNTKNKKVVESMLNEDLESFKKLLNFSIKV